ncbi:MAG TPA: COX15/CtaA family protein [Pirellulales bacterium]
MTSSSVKSSPVYSALAHHSVWVLLGCTLVLIGVGAVVTTLKAGMAVPDWPTTFEHNMFTYPLDRWLFNRDNVPVLVEHSHRLLGSLVGMVTIVVVGLFAWFEKRPAVRWWATLVLVLVVTQGFLGGFRVLLKDQQLAMIHACLAQLFFISGVALSVVSSRRWIAGVKPNEPHPTALPYAALGVTGLTYVQIVLGAIVRHFPSAHAVIAHVVGAGIVTLACVALVTVVLTKYGKASGLRGLAVSLIVVVLLQVTIGVAAYVARYGAPGYTVELYGPAHLHSTVAHLLVGSALLGVCTAMTLWSFRLARLTSPAPAAQSEPAARSLEVVR